MLPLTTPLRCRRWSEQELFASRDAWRELALRSGADRLFLSWEWICCWWRRHGAALGAELRVYAVTDAAGTLVGIAPFYLHTARHLGLLRARRLEFIGAAWRREGAVFSEYLDIVSAAQARSGITAALAAELLADAGWDELVLANMTHDSVAGQLAGILSAHMYARQVETMTGWGVALPQSFDEFLARLSSNTRRKLHNQRNKLPASGYLVIPAAEWSASLSRLDGFLAGRWGGAKSGTVRAFHEDIIRALPEESIRLSELRSGKQCVSVMLNIRAGDTEYYLQSGFDAAFGRGMSPGYLHLGHAIEAACREGVRRFDLLAGRGLNRDYKRDLVATATPLSTLHLVRRSSLRAVFRAADRLRGRTDITSRA